MEPRGLSAESTTGSVWLLRLSQSKLRSVAGRLRGHEAGVPFKSSRCIILPSSIRRAVHRAQLLSGSNEFEFRSDPQILQNDYDYANTGISKRFSHFMSWDNRFGIDNDIDQVQQKQSRVADLTIVYNID